MSTSAFTVNGRDYLHSGRPVVVICIDGSEPAYHRQALADGRMPWLAGVLEGSACDWPAHCAMPALTNPNNVSIATGRPPRDHGISGNYLLDPESGREVLMNDASFLRIPTLFAAATDAGLDVAVVTAKDKLRRLLGAGLVEPGPNPDGSPGIRAPARTGICFSAERADRATAERDGLGDVLSFVGRELPSVYSAELSEFVLAAGVRLLEEYRPDLMYLSLTDYIQHTHAPGTPVANDFYAMIDRYAARLDELGAVLVITGDHGMSAKSDPAGLPRIVYVEDEIRKVAPDLDGVRVILPITDPYTVHHGALGSFATVHLSGGGDPAVIGSSLARLPGVQSVHSRIDAAERFALPADRIGDLVVLAEAGTALGRTPEAHDLGQLDAPLRSHGALGELHVPFLVNCALDRPPELDQDIAAPAVIHNYDAFWVGTTAVTQAAASRTAPR